MLRKKTTCKNKYQHKLITLISTISYINRQFKKYSQNRILYYFNGNLKRNGHKEIKIKTLQSYLYKLEKEFQVTSNYYQHLGINMGTAIYYKLQYSKKECYRRINKNFKERKENRHLNRVDKYYQNKKACNKNSSVEKWECINNINNNNKEEKIKLIEKLQVMKYVKKCKFKTDEFLSILNLKISKDEKIKALREMKKNENRSQKNLHNEIRYNGNNKSKLQFKQQELSRILYEAKVKLEKEGYIEKQLEKEVQKVYENYKSKPHFIIENDKYDDLKKIIGKIEMLCEKDRKDVQNNERNIKDNIFSILLDQLRHKTSIEILLPVLKNYLNKQEKLDYRKAFNNQYYYELLELLENKENYCKLQNFKESIH
ncbi:plasmid maintenance protein [Borrelia hispanica]|uniref:plasmid maintenance protein n=1 Tax=Borrelia hispanica TaxID=40835 RepID=UPI0004654108|nr:plasmid maintenance protein [Borrelia hispanica]